MNEVEELPWIRAELNLSANVENGIIIFSVVPANTQEALPGRPAGPGHGPLDYVVHNRNRERGAHKQMIYASKKRSLGLTLESQGDKLPWIVRECFL